MTLTAGRPPASKPSGSVVDADDAPASHRIPYEPALDGLRGLAVLAVVLYHAGVGWATGGYLGVDAFFVLSGYLITSLLLAEFRDTHGIDLRRFWMRRVRRLLPALLVALVVVAAFCVFAAGPDVLAQIRGDGLATLTYVMNWRSIALSQSYFDQFTTSPLKHAWSLAIEEQYYLFWPIITIAVLSTTRWRRRSAPLLPLASERSSLADASEDTAAGSVDDDLDTEATEATDGLEDAPPRRPPPPAPPVVRRPWLTRVGGDDPALAGPRRLLLVCGGLALASALWMLVGYRGATIDDPSRLYYGTDTRAQSLLVGSALAAAIAAGWRIPADRRRSLVIAAAVALVALGAAWMWLPATSGILYRGGFLVLALAVGLLVTVCTQVGDNPVRRGLSFEPMRALGLVSYGLYLYHFPIYAWLTADRTGLEPGSLRLLLLRLTVALAAAVASYFAVEKPIRSGALTRLHIRPGWQVLLAPTAVALVVVLLLSVTSGATNSIPTPDDYAASKRPPPTTSAPGAVPLTRVLLVGDSVAFRLGVGFEDGMAEAHNISFWNQAVLFCELINAPHIEQGQVKAASGTCANWEADWRSSVSIFKPQVSILELGAWEIFDREINGQWVAFGTPEFDAILMPVLQKAVDALSSSGAPVAVLTTPRFQRRDSVSSQEWTVNESGRTDHFNLLLRQLAAANPTKVRIIDLAGFLCPGGTCIEQMNGVPMRPDGLHFEQADARIVADWLAPQLQAIADSATPAGSTSTTAAPAATTVPAASP